VGRSCIDQQFMRASLAEEEKEEEEEED